MSYTPVNHNVTVDVTNGSVSPDSISINETDTVTWIPTGGTILAIQPEAGSQNLFSSGPSQASGSINWEGIAGNTDGTESYKLQVQPTGGDAYWIDPKLKISHPPSS